MRITGPTIRVLQYFLADPARERYGYELLQSTGIKSGSLYPILNRLETAQWIDGVWRESPHPGRPRRRSYKLTGLGQRQAKIILSEKGAGVRQLGVV
jgi:DNA-binding PadR family transcriptional regulator